VIVVQASLGAVDVWAIAGETNASARATRRVRARIITLLLQI
jgi:hypothetical protein